MALAACARQVGQEGAQGPTDQGGRGGGGGGGGAEADGKQIALFGRGQWGRFEAPIAPPAAVRWVPPSVRRRQEQEREQERQQEHQCAKKAAVATAAGDGDRSSAGMPASPAGVAAAAVTPTKPIGGEATTPSSRWVGSKCRPHVIV